MREIKFRAWDKSRKVMHSPEQMGRDQLTICPNGNGFINVHGRSTQSSVYYKHLIPLQYSDFKDIKDKQICEGDNIHLNFESEGGEKWDATVVFKNGAFYLEWKSDEYESGIDEMELYFGFKNAEVIGNIYEQTKE